MIRDSPLVRYKRTIDRLAMLRRGYYDAKRLPNGEYIADSWRKAGDHQRQVCDDLRDQLVEMGYSEAEIGTDAQHRVVV